MWFCVAAGVACVRRIVELEAGGAAQRPALTYYSVRGLSRFADCGITFIIALCVLDRFQSPGFYLVSSTAYLLFVLFARRIGALQSSLAWLWLR